MSQVCCLAGMDTDSTGPICNDKHCQGLEQNGQQLKKMLLRGPIRFSSGRPPNQGSNKIAGEMTGRCASVPASGNQHSTGLRKTLEACCIYPVLIPGSHRAIDHFHLPACSLRGELLSCSLSLLSSSKPLVYPLGSGMAGLFPLLEVAAPGSKS